MILRKRYIRAFFSKKVKEGLKSNLKKTYELDFNQRLWLVHKASVYQLDVAREKFLKQVQVFPLIIPLAKSFIRDF